MTNANQNIARPEGYSAAEKLLSWARMSWRHTGLLSFVFLAVMTVYSLDLSLDEVSNSIVSGGVSDPDDLDLYDRYQREFSTYPVALLFGLTGVVVDKFIGRFYGLVIALCVTVLGGILMSVVNVGPAGAVVLYAVSSWYGIRFVYGMAAIYCYESVPLRFRLVVLIFLPLAETFGRLLMSLTDRLISEDKDEEEIWPTRKRTMAIIPSVLFVITLAVGFFFNKKDTPLSYVNARSQAGTAFDLLVKEGVENTAEPIPMTRDEFEASTTKDLDRLGNLRTLWGIVKRALIGPVAVVASVLLAFMIFRKVLVPDYHYLTSDYLGEGYARNYIPMMLLENGTAIGGAALSIGLWFWIKDIRFLPAAGFMLAALGSVVCASVNTNAPEGYPYSFEELTGSMTKVTSGVAMILLGRPLAESLFRVIILDLFTTENRATGFFGARMIELIFSGIVSALAFHYRTEQMFIIICASLVTVVGAAIFAVFYTTQWFEHSLVFRDPELDACWLISAEEASRLMVDGSEPSEKKSPGGRG